MRHTVIQEPGMSKNTIRILSGIALAATAAAALSQQPAAPAAATHSMRFHSPW